MLSAGLFAKPKLVSCSLRQGNGPVRINSLPSRIDWLLGNPDDAAATVTLQVRPSQGELEAVFSREVTIPPKMEISGNAEFVALDTSEFLVELKM